MTAPIDCDAHNVVGPVATLEPYLDDHWREVIATSQFAGPTDQAHPPNLATSRREDLPADAGRTLAAMQAQLLDPLGVECAILSCDYGIESVRNPDAAARAGHRGQPLAGRRVARSRAAAAGRDHARRPAARDRDRGARALGRRPAVRRGLPAGPLERSPTATGMWWPLWEAIAARGLVAELHFGGSPGVPPTASGWPTSWLEEYVDMASAFAAQLTSLVVEGVFDVQPTLRVALIESGFAWLPAFLWRLDKSWRGLRREIPWTTRLPSEYVREHVRVSLQPVDGPPDPVELARVIEQLGSERMLMFSSDYPHRHSAEGLAALPQGLSPDVLAATARELYRL